jgi:hypothetical protein
MWWANLSEQGPGLKVRRNSMEILVPAQNATSRSSPIISSSLLLLSTMIGGGMLTLPYAVSMTGEFVLSFILSKLWDFYLVGWLLDLQVCSEGSSYSWFRPLRLAFLYTFSSPRRAEQVTPSNVGKSQYFEKSSNLICCVCMFATPKRAGASSYAVVAADAFGPEAAHAVALLTLALTFMCITAYRSVLSESRVPPSFDCPVIMHEENLRAAPFLY